MENIPLYFILYWENMKNVKKYENVNFSMLLIFQISRLENRTNFKY